jgi:hypothetical protein
MNFKALALAAVTATSIISAPAAQAKGTYAEHIQLGNAVRSTGVTFKINPSDCWQKNAYGWYWAAKNEMVICQQNKRYQNVEVRWTEEDLDTLRHEAQHLIQDCMDGQRQGSLDAVYKTPIELAKEVLGPKGIRAVLEAYSDASDHIKVMELEAFSVAAMNDPAEQTRDIQNYCF